MKFFDQRIRKRTVATTLASIMVTLIQINIGNPAYANEDYSSVSLSTEALAAMPTNLQDQFNAQINSEIAGAYIYLDLATYFHLKSLDGIGKWFTAQFYEEVNHARIITNFLVDKGVEVKMTQIPSPTIAKGTPLEVFRDSLALEEAQTAKIHSLYALALSLNQHDSAVFLNRFLNEQVEEESMFRKILDKLIIIGNDPAGLLALDRELGARAIPAPFNPPAG